MKEILLQEDDRKIFGASLSAEEFLYYIEHKDVMRTMWKEQGHVFWLNTLAKFRIYIVKHGSLAPFNTMVNNGSLDYPFITIAKKMTGSFGDVAELLTDISMVMRNMHLTANMVKPTCAYDPFINPTTRNSFRNLFGPPDNKLRILRTFIFAETFCSWGGSLIRLLPIWKIAPRVNPAPRPGMWSPPTSYTRQTPLRTGPFEQYLKNHWREEIFDVCGAPPQQLVWWKSLPAGGPTTLPPMQEYTALSVVLDYLMDIADDVQVDGPAPDLTKPKSLPTRVKKSAATQEPSPSPSPAAGTEKKKKKKKKKDASKEEAKTAAKGGAKPKQAAAAVVPEPEPEPMDTPLRFPAPARVVLDATLDWHEYVTAVLGTDHLLRNQVLGGRVLLGWAVLIIEDTVPRMGHIPPDMRENIRKKHGEVREYWTVAKKALAVKCSANTAILRDARDRLSTQLEEAGIVLSAVTSMRYLPSPEPAADLGRIRALVQQALDSTVLRLFPVIYQYSVTETAVGDPRLVYPDFSRIRYVMRKGLAFLDAPLPTVESRLQLAAAAAIEWYPELRRLPEQAAAHIRAQLRPGGVLARRIEEPHVYDLQSEQDLLVPIDLSGGGSFSAVMTAMMETRAMTGYAAGPLPPRPALLLPHNGQSLVDAYWCRLGAMMFFTDLITMVPVTVPVTVNAAILTFKFDRLNVLFDSVIELQLAQWRWLYPRSELELPRRPAFRCAADLDLMTSCLDHADKALKDAHEHLRSLYHTLKKSFFGKDHAKSEQLMPMRSAHWRIDGCGDESNGDNFSHCRDCLEHAYDVANRRVLLAMSMLIRPGLNSGASIGKVVETLHLLPAFLVAIQDYKTQPSKSTWQPIEKMLVGIAPTSDGPEVRKVQQTVNDFCGTGTDKVFMSPRQLGNRESNTREFMLTACCHLGTRIMQDVSKGRLPMAPAEYEKALSSAAGLLLLNEPESDYAMSGGAMAGPSPQRLRLTVVWPIFLTSAHVGTADWRRCVPDADAAAAALQMVGRTEPSAMAKLPCTERAGTGDKARTHCGHDGAERLLCLVLQMLRNVSFTEYVLRGVRPAWEISVHRSVLNVLRECWLPYLLGADRLFRGQPTSNKLYSEHLHVIEDCSGWFEKNLANLFKSRPKIGPGRMLRFDRSWMTSAVVLRPDNTLCRTISWMQACDLHMEMMRRLSKTLWFLRTRLPPAVEDGCEVHPAPLELLERVETGAVLLVAAFLDYRDGRSARHLLDVSELDDQVALALDAHGWLGLFDTIVTQSPAGVQHPMFEGHSELLRVCTERAFTSYERALRHGSLLEFLALRPAYAVPLQLAVTANRRPDPQSLAALRQRTGDMPGETIITLPPLSELCSRAGRDHALPMEWMVRLQQLRRVLLSSARPQLLDATLVYLDYQLGCSADRLPDLPTFDGPQNMSDSGMFTAGCSVDAEALCNHVFDLGQHVLKYQAAMKTSFYLNQNDHVFPDRRFFIKPSGLSGATRPQPPAPQTGDRAAITKWASEHVVRQLRGVRRGDQELNGASAPAANGAQEQKSETQLSTIERLSRELEGLLLSANHLKDIPEEPLAPSLLERAGRRAERLSEGARQLPDGPLRGAAGRLIDCVQRAVVPPQPGRRRRKARTIAGSEMSVVDTCLSMLSSVLSQHGLAVTEDSSASESEAEPAGAAAALRVCSFCEDREKTPGTFELCSLCVTEGAPAPRAYCGKPCQTDDWEVSHWEDHN